MFFGRSIGRIFSEDPVVINGIALFLAVSSFSYGLRGICMITISMFNAVNMPIRATLLNTLRTFGLYVPLAYLGAVHFGFKGVFFGMTTGNILAGLFALFWIRKICMKCEMDAYLNGRVR